MSKPEAIILLTNEETRRRAVSWVMAAEAGSSFAYRGPKRTLDQNSYLHLLCTDVAVQVPWGGKKRDVEAWKDIFTAALLSARNELDVVPGINGGFVLLGMHTSSLSKADCADLISLILAWGTQNGVTFSDTALFSQKER